MQKLFSGYRPVFLHEEKFHEATDLYLRGYMREVSPWLASVRRVKLCDMKRTLWSVNAAQKTLIEFEIPRTGQKLVVMIYLISIIIIYRNTSSISYSHCDKIQMVLLCSRKGLNMVLP